MNYRQLPRGRKDAHSGKLDVLEIFVERSDIIPKKRLFLRNFFFWQHVKNYNSVVKESLPLRFWITSE